MPRSLRILASAYACHPELGSEEGSGWNLVRQLARLGEVWCVTLPEHRAAIEAVAPTALPNVRFVYHDVPGWSREHNSARRFVRTHYNAWQATLLPVARKLHREVGFDVTQHLTYAQYWSGSYLPFVKAPFVWGPVAGGESCPPSFLDTLDDAGRGYERKRDLARSIGLKYPIVHLCARRAAAALASTHETEAAMRRIGTRNITVQLSAGLPDNDFERLAALPLHSGGPFRVISIGRLLQWKGFHLGLRSFAEAHRTHPDSEYWVLGEGPDRALFERLASELGIADAVRFWGKVDRDVVLDCLTQCDALVHPSLHEGAGWVTMEAAAAGLPVICLDLGGPAVQVNDATGYKVAADDPTRAIEAMAQAMLALANDPAHRQAMGAAAREHARNEFLWDHAGNVIGDLAPYRAARERIARGG